MARVLLIDDNDLLRGSIYSAVSSHPDIRIVGEGSDGSEALDLVTLHKPDVVVMDAQMPRTDGIEATRLLRHAHPGLPVIAHSSDPNAAVAMLAAGASLFVLKGAVAELVEAILQVLE